MAIVSTVPRRSVNLPAGSIFTLISSTLGGRLIDGPEHGAFLREMAAWLGVPQVYGASSGRSAFQLALEALDLEQGREIIFPVFTFPVMPMVAKRLGYRPVFCDVDPYTLNAGPEHFAARINDRTGAMLATHLFGQPCPIRELATLARDKDIRLMEDCAHGLGVRVDGKQVGTFGDIGIYSFAEGKNMPCFAGGAIATADEEIARRAERALDNAPAPAKWDLVQQAASIWIKWLLTRPSIFGLTAYPVLRLKLATGQPLMDSAVGDDLLRKYEQSNPRVVRFSNLQGAVGRQQLRRIDAFNDGARRNAQILTEYLGDVPGVQAPKSDGDHIYVYYPLMVDPAKRDDLRHYLLRQGIDTKITDMSDCSRLEPFRDDDFERKGPTEASILEVCVYPNICEKQIRKIGQVIRKWAGLAPVA
jgi:dTDP-4-amino-4,6-dideoxygalactose transaminase